MVDISEEIWNEIRSTLEREKCVLFIGQGIYYDQSEIDIENSLKSILINTENPINSLVSHYGEDGFILFKKNKTKKYQAISKIKSFFEQQFPQIENALLKLTQIPFSILITLTYDNLLAKAFNKYGFPYQTDYFYFHKMSNKFFVKPTSDRPLIYNLIGNIEEPDSIVLSHDDFFNYIDSIIKSQEIFNDLKSQIKGSRKIHIF
ncbi:MAG: SIR2 family protein [Saprospiraceae bacterium]|nr:SIR2 family protein [Saprospiraceae bacterium]